MTDTDTFNFTVRPVIDRLEKTIEGSGYEGWDPYDGLNSGFLKFWTFDVPALRLWAQQFMKRSPINLRPLLGVPKQRNPKGLGLLARACIHRHQKTQQDEYRRKATEILTWLMENNSNRGGKYHGTCWGYNFDWQSAVFYIPRGGPTVVNTCFIANAFLDAHEAFGDKQYLDVARSACDFILNDLHKTARGQNFCFSYSPFDTSVTHNANLLAAELLARVYKHTGETTLVSHAGRAVDFTLYHFNADGSIYQGTAPQQKFVDSFHTGFVLVSLWNIAAYSDLEEKNAQYMRIMRNAYNYYRRVFFEKSGQPHYYHDKAYPIDLHCTAQGIVTFLTFKSHDYEAVDRAKILARWAIDNMWDEQQDCFWHRRGRFVTNKIQYLRWPNIWMLYALTVLEF